MEFDVNEALLSYKQGVSVMEEANASENLYEEEAE